jgi:hypothetical protein
MDGWVWGGLKERRGGGKGEEILHTHAVAKPFSRSRIIPVVIVDRDSKECLLKRKEERYRGKANQCGIYLSL